jgi:NAD(P)-dependent dehydrogenase (short-subunit alcohol dehydrogenase family)
MSQLKPIALITGANRGIGFELARTLARDHSFHVLLGSRDVVSGTSALAVLSSEGLSVELLILDTNFDDSIMAAAKNVEQNHGRLDVLVNNAGISIDPYPTTEFTQLRRVFQDTFNTNVFGSATVTEAFIPLLYKSSLPRIVFISSTLGSIGNRVDPHGAWQQVPLVSYRCSKAALNMLCATFVARLETKGGK